MAKFHQMARKATSLRMLMDSDSGSDEDECTNTTKDTTEVDVTTTCTVNQCQPNEIHQVPSPELVVSTSTGTNFGGTKVAEENEAGDVDHDGKAVFKRETEFYQKFSYKKKPVSPTSKSLGEDSRIQLAHKVSGTPWSGYINFTTKYRNNPNSHDQRRAKKDGEVYFKRVTQFQDEHYEFDY